VLEGKKLVVGEWIVSNASLEDAAPVKQIAPATFKLKVRLLIPFTLDLHHPQPATVFLVIGVVRRELPIQ
jgi:hypothetical protein